MFQFVIDDNLWLQMNIDRLFYLDVNLINTAIVLVIFGVFLRARKVYRTRKATK